MWHIRSMVGLALLRRLDANRPNIAYVNHSLNSLKEADYLGDEYKGHYGGYSYFRL